MEERLENIHPGEILQEEFLKPMSISAYRLAKETRMPNTRVSEILRHKRRITADTALRLSKFFGTSPEFWLNLQMEFDLREERQEKADEIDSITPYQALGA
jgi:addiction module HigA family antidote